MSISLVVLPAYMALIISFAQSSPNLANITGKVFKRIARPPTAISQRPSVTPPNNPSLVAFNSLGFESSFNWDKDSSSIGEPSPYLIWSFVTSTPYFFLIFFFTMSKTLISFNVSSLSKGLLFKYFF